MKKERLVMERGAGNVFADLGVADAEEHLMKAGLVARIDGVVRQRGMTQAEAAEVLGVDEPEAAALVRGHFRGYSVERLMEFLVALGQDVETA